MEIKESSLTFKGLKVLDLLLMRIFGIFAKSNLSKTINYYGIDEEDECVFLDFGNRQKLYAIKLETTGNDTIAVTDFENIVRDAKFNANSQVLLSFVKQPDNEAIYVFSQNKNILLSFAESFNVFLLKPYQILSAIYHIFLLQVFDISHKQLINRYNDNKLTEEPDLLYKEFPSLISIASDNMLQEYTPYQITSIKDTIEFSIIDFLSASWQGVCFLFFDFEKNKVPNRLRILESSAKLGDNKYIAEYKHISKDSGENKEASRLLNENCCLVNGMFFLKNKNSAGIFQNLLGVTAEERYFNIEKILPKTLLLTRDIDFDIISELDVVQKYFQTSLRKDCIQIIREKGALDDSKNFVPDFYGKDINGNFFNYTFKESTNPHALIFGTTGAGKSVAILKIISQIIDYDFKFKIAHSLNQNKKVRYLNVGYTGGWIFNNIKKNMNKNGKKVIEILPTSISKLRFNLFDFEDFKNPNEEEIKMFIAFINLMLNISSNNGESLSVTEEAELIRTLKYMLDNEKYVKMKLGEILMTFGDDYKDIIEEILAITDENDKPLYDMETTADKLPQEYQNFFNRPVVKDLLNIISENTKSINLNDKERKTCETLYEKLKIFDANKVFGFYANISTKENYPCYYADFDTIKEDLVLFVSIGWLLIKNWFKYDKLQAKKAMNKGEKLPDCYYVIEEAHNFLNIPVFAKLINVFAREVRKFGIQLTLITQSVTDLSKELNELFSTKLFLFTEKDKDIAYKNIKITNAGEELAPKSKQVFDKIHDGLEDNRTIFMTHTDGVNAFRLPKYEEYKKLFTPLAIE